MAVLLQPAAAEAETARRAPEPDKLRNKRSRVYELCALLRRAQNERAKSRRSSLGSIVGFVVQLCVVRASRRSHADAPLTTLA